MKNATSSLFCDGCDAVIPDIENHWHCYVCDNGDYDLCQLCVDEDIKCPGGGRHLVQRAFANPRADCSRCRQVLMETTRSYRCNICLNEDHRICGECFDEDSCCAAGGHDLIRYQAQIPQIFCNNCGASIPEVEVFSHCEQCSDGNDGDKGSIDLCKKCADDGLTCTGISHVRSRCYFANEELSSRKRCMFIMDEEIR